MSDKLDLFTKRAKRVLTLSQENCLRLNHDYVGTAHLLVGLASEAHHNFIEDLLREFGVTPAQIILAVEVIIGRGDRGQYERPTLSPRFQRVIDLAADEARLREHNYVGVEHLFLGLLREGEGGAIHVLRTLKIDVNRLHLRASSIVTRANDRKGDDSC